ncbi:MAG: transcription elongation factor GreA [Spirochaetales bacterium]|nr:transcription elongation factor GreA [Spirochaetales bacterium]
MPEAITKSLNELLNKEKWTRATLNSYSIGNFKELDEILTEAEGEEDRQAIKDICDEHLVHSKNSIIALYLSGIIALSQHMVDDTNLIMLINIFFDNHKWNIVEFLCNQILQYGENKYALRTLSDCYINNNEDDKKFEIWERLIKVDYDEADIVKMIANKKEAESNLEEAIDYYKKAIYRFINKKQFASIKEIWSKIFELSPADSDFFFHIERKIAKAFEDDKSSGLLHSILSFYMDKSDWDISIRILKRILSYDPKDVQARKQIVNCYKAKFKEHSQLDEYIRISNLAQNWRNVHDAILDFEKHIAFDKGNYVFHRSWGIGLITESKDDTFVINFPRKKDHKMSLKMAVSALKTLENEHIWVLKSTMKKEDLKKKIKEDIPWALRIIIKSYDNAVNMKKIKAEFVPSLLTPSEWTKWNTEARKFLKTDPYFGNVSDKLDIFEVRETPISFEEKTFNKFKAEKNFFQRLKTILDYMKHAEPDSEFFNDMFSYFVAFCKTYNNVTEMVMSSFLLVQRVVSNYSFLNPGLDITFNDLFSEIEDIKNLFIKIDDNDLKRDFLVQVRKNIDNWSEIYTSLFHYFQSKFIIDELFYSKKLDNIKDLFSTSMDLYKDLRETFIWLVKNISTETWFKKFGFSEEKILICLVHLLDITYREISNRRDVSLNRKLNKQILTILFKDNRLMDYINIADRDSISRLITLVDDVKELDPSIKIQTRHSILEKFPDFKFLGEHIVEKTKSKMLVLRQSYEEKQKDLKNILEVEVPKNSKEIGEAMAKGDLRENAEYKAALEKQDILNAACSKLQKELRNAQIFDPSGVDVKAVSFGTKIALENIESTETEEYTILGPWESDPVNNIISYLSPFGSEVYNHKIGETMKFVINEKEYNYKVLNIQKAI